ncbi:hypothetical protein Pcinc_012552 [Petrolisthes cinctipes]|uniref:Uncharacterized protein n=1 Tax=Petrolisthes cinctipes TaxID=88211 RepID=A0AAE1FYT7_PETCI|nr:hypothetical protein Pcinc_012552 [Petrolisthes cinctipes]
MLFSKDGQCLSAMKDKVLTCLSHPCLYSNTLSLPPTISASHSPGGTSLYSASTLHHTSTSIHSSTPQLPASLQINLQDLADETTVMSQLLHLEKSLRKTRRIRDTLLGYFSPFLCLMLVTNVSVLITSIFYWIRLYTFSYLAYAYINAVCVCVPRCLAQRFTNQVRYAALDLRDASVNIPDLNVKAHMWRVSQDVEGLAVLNVWELFTLNHRSILAVGAFVGAYLVVLLQSG